MDQSKPLSDNATDNRPASSQDRFIDMHCHPSIKPFGRSYPLNINSRFSWRRSSIWHQKLPTKIRQLLNRTLSITRFTQTDMTTLSEGNVSVIAASFAPLEKNFFISRVGEGPLVDMLTDWITGIGRLKVNYIQRNKNYFREFRKKYNFYLRLHGKKQKIHGGVSKYRLVSNYDEILTNMGKDIISVIPSLEGAHVFTEDNTRAPEREQILGNIDKMLSWQYPPFFVAPAHHFRNYIAGHAYSLPKVIRALLNQKEGVNTGITELGLEVIGKLLDHKILIDIKHMSRQSRRDYYQLLKSPAYRNIPILASHTSVNGYPDVYSDADLEEDHGVFFGLDINIFDNEILLIARSGGIIGIQLDERRIASRQELKKVKNDLPEEDKLRLLSGFVWNQVAYIAILLDSADLSAWDCETIGSDYDGMVDPLNGFWTAKEYKLLYDHLLIHARAYLAGPGQQFKLEENNISAEEILDKLFSKNALHFLENNFNHE